VVGRTLAGVALALVAATAAGSPTARAAEAQATAQPRTFPVALDRSAELEPGVLHGFALGRSSLDRGYVAEVTPSSASADGANVASFVEPEFDGRRWRDVLRAELRAGAATVEANLRAYAVARLPRALDTDAELEPGVLHGFVLGPAAVDRGYVAEVTPRSASVDGAHVTSLVQPEFDGTSWRDVLRVQLLGAPAGVRAHVRVYSITGLPPALDATSELQPGVLHGFALGPASERRGYVVEVTPSSPSAGGAQVRSFAQPEVDGASWNDVVRVQLLAGPGAVSASIRAYAIRARE
jgi:hypothetical protein